MKAVLQAFEPLHRPAGTRHAEIAATETVRKSSPLRLTPVVADARLFHAWRA